MLDKPKEYKMFSHLKNAYDFIFKEMSTLFMSHFWKENTNNIFLKWMIKQDVFFFLFIHLSYNFLKSFFIMILLC